MRDMPLPHLLTALVVGLALGVCAVPSLAADLDAGQPVGETVTVEQARPAAHFETEGSYSLGYRWVSSEDSLKSAEYANPIPQ